MARSFWSTSAWAGGGSVLVPAGATHEIGPASKDTLGQGTATREVFQIGKQTKWLWTSMRISVLRFSSAIGVRFQAIEERRDIPVRWS